MGSPGPFLIELVEGDYILGCFGSGFGAARTQWTSRGGGICGTGLRAVVMGSVPVSARDRNVGRAACPVWITRFACKEAVWSRRNCKLRWDPSGRTRRLNSRRSSQRRGLLGCRLRENGRPKVHSPLCHWRRSRARVKLYRYGQTLPPLDATLIPSHRVMVFKPSAVLKQRLGCAGEVIE